MKKMLSLISVVLLTSTALGNSLSTVFSQGIVNHPADQITETANQSADQATDVSVADHIETLESSTEISVDSDPIQEHSKNTSDSESNQEQTTKDVETSVSEEQKKQPVASHTTTSSSLEKTKTAFKRSIDDEFSMGSIFDEGMNDSHKTEIVVVPNPHPDADEPADFMFYDSTVLGLQTALYDLYQHGNNQNYVLYIGKDLTIASQASLTARTDTATGTADVSFYSLRDKVNQLTITGSANDPVSGTETTSNAAYSFFTLATTGSVDFGTNITIRNLRYRANTMYSNGNELTLGTGSYGTTVTNIYGGSDSSDITGNPTLTIQSTGAGSWNIYGGNRSGGVVNGNITTNILDASGTIATIAGAGNNSSIVNGNVSTTINVQNANTSLTITNFYGGTSANSETEINGTVTNNIKGRGKWTTTLAQYYGGSYVGTIASSNGQAINNIVDTSSFSSGSAMIVGANRTNGAIQGDITNVLKAGKPNKGSFSGVNGGNSSSSTGVVMSTKSEAEYDAASPAQRQADAQNQAGFRVQGNISTNILEGCVSYSSGEAGYVRGAGYNGYILGNVTLMVGTDNNGLTGGPGFVYDDVHHDVLPYSNTLNNRSSSLVDFDIFGGGSEGIHSNRMYIKGDTTVILNNVLARWTYGGSYSGTTEGESKIILNGGIVNTLEGSGYGMYRHFGKSSAILNNGQVDDFFCGGSWDDWKQVGDTYAEVNGGVVNATFGGNFGNSSRDTIIGNSKVLIRGGDFTGKPDRGWAKALTAGPTQGGSIVGDLELTLDLRTESAATFTLPKNTNISAGKPDSARSAYVSVGKDEQTTLTLNIFTKPGVDVLNGATILGDSTPNANTTAGKIIMNINAPDSTLGNILATEQTNTLSNKILRDVDINVQNAASVGGISGGSENDNFTNTIVSNSDKKVDVDLGTIVDTMNPAVQKDSIKFTTMGLINFTDLKLENGITLEASTGSIKNGGGATAGNHWDTYNQFGDITMSEDAEIAITEKNSLISAGALTTTGNSKITSYAGSGIINISDFIVAKNKAIQWNKLGTGEALVSNLNGKWFGVQDAYQVITVNPDGAKAEQITPVNFSGIEVATGKTFIGDNAQVNSNGYGIAIPGSIIDYQVIEGMATGSGSIYHNVLGVKENNAPLAIEAWGTDVAGKEVKQGKLMIPASSDENVQLTFSPDEVSGSWFYQGTIHSTEKGSVNQVLSESDTTDPVEWKATSLNYSYSIDVSYSNLVELSAKNVILHETDAVKISSAAEIVTLTEASGRPFLENDVDEAKVAAVAKKLEKDEIYRKVPIEYQAGYGTDNTKKVDVNIVVIRDSAVISKEGTFAIYAEDTAVRLEDANSLNTKTDLNAWTKAQVIFADNRENVSPDVADSTFDEIKNTSPEETLPKEVPTEYFYTEHTDTAEKLITITVVEGTLQLTEVPTQLDFGQMIVQNNQITKFGQTTGNLIVTDTRGPKKATWTITLREKEQLTSANNSLVGCLSYQTGHEEVPLSETMQIIESLKLEADGEKIISDNWNGTDYGIKVSIPVEKQKIGEYTGTLEWNLVDGPGQDAE